MSHHNLHATPETIRFGMFSAQFPAVLTIASGDTVTVETFSGGLEAMPAPGSGLSIPAGHAAILAANPPRIGPHLLTGPIAITGAEPGDMLEIRIEHIEFAADWGFNVIRPLAGTLPEDFPDPVLSHITIDRTQRVGRMPWGTEIPLAPFFGVMGVLPPPQYGTLSSREPREHGGNIDNKELGAGSTLYLPVFAPGAGFMVGDGHGVQGDGEVCTTALEISLTGTFTFLLHKHPDSPFTWPRAESPTHWITMGMHEDLDQAMKKALREMIAFIQSRTNLSAAQAYQICSLGVDFHVTQTVNGEKGVHGMLPKGLLF